MNVRCAIETFSEYSTQKKTDFLLQLAHTLTILARDTDEVGQKRLINLSAEKKKAEKLMQAARLRLINEVHHRVISFNEEKRYPDEEFVRKILEHPEDSELQRQLRDAFDLMVQVVESVPEVGAAPPPEVLVHCVHGTFPRGWWRQQLWNAATRSAGYALGASPALPPFHLHMVTPRSDSGSNPIRSWRMLCVKSSVRTRVGSDSSASFGPAATPFRRVRRRLRNCVGIWPRGDERSRELSI